MMSGVDAQQRLADLRSGRRTRPGTARANAATGSSPESHDDDRADEHRRARPTTSGVTDLARDRHPRALRLDGALVGRAHRRTLRVTARSPALRPGAGGPASFVPPPPVM